MYKLDDRLGDCEWVETKGSDDRLLTLRIEGGHKLTVLDRLTGWGGGVRDIESGYTNPRGKFWLASCMFDIRMFPDLSIKEAIVYVKKNANTCVAG
jgi:hypothetical protein